MKKLICLLMVTILMVGVFAGCGSSDDRVLYNDVNLEEYVELCDYKGIKVDTSSEDVEKIYKEILENDVNENSFFTYEQLTEGKLENGDIANIDYTGKKDGVAFEGGTAKSQELELGSGQFIEGFEEGLVGVEIGKTVDLDLTFPENYHSADLAGAAVVFTVTVNSAQRKVVQKPEEYFSKLGFESVSKYRENCKKRAVENYLVQTVVESSKVKEYPEAEIEIIYSTTMNAVKINLEEQYGMDFETYLSQIGQTEEEYKEIMIEDQIKPSMEVQMVLYAILDREEIEFTKDEIEKEIDKVVKSVNNESVTAETVKSVYGDYYFEEVVVTEKVIEFLYKNCKLK